MARRRLLPGADARQGLVALALNSSTSLVAGAMLGSLTATFERRPGLLVLIPAAIGLRGNVFGSLGNRVSTSIHAGELQLRLRRIHRPRAERAGRGGPHPRHVPRPGRARGPRRRWASASGASIGLADLALVSVGRRRARVDPRAGGHARAGGAARSATGGTSTTSRPRSCPRSATSSPCPPSTSPPGCSGWASSPRRSAGPSRRVAVVALVAGARSSLPQLRRIVRTSIPVLVIAGLVSSLAGVALEAAAHDLRRASRAPDPRARPPLERRRARGHPLGPPVEPAPPRSRGTDGRPVPRRPARPLVRRRAERAGVRRSTASARTSSRACSARRRPGWHTGRRVAARRARRDGRGDRDRLLRHDRHRPARDRPRHLRHPDGQLHGRPRRRA